MATFHVPGTSEKTDRQPPSPDISEKSSIAPGTIPLADRDAESTSSTTGDALLRFLRIRPPKVHNDLDAVSC